MVKQTKGRGWSATLARPIVLRDGTKLDTLADVRAFILEELSQADQARNAWQKAAELLLSTAEEKGDIAVVTQTNRTRAVHAGQMAAEMTEPQKNRIMIYGPKDDGTYVVEFRTAAGESLGIQCPAARPPC
jgi:hypothetical protein